VKRTNSIRLLCLVAALAASAASAQTTVYRWIDKDGKVQFSDNPPPAGTKDYTEKRVGSGPADDGQVPYATQMAATRNPVTLYASGDCGELCTQGRELLAKRGVPYREKDAKDSAVADEIRDLIGALQVPVLKVGQSALKGYSEELWQAALDQAGYAKSRLPGQPGYKPQ
jgi:glutaredoxin